MEKSIERKNIRDIMQAEERRRHNMISCGFEEDKEYGGFIKEGYGRFITNTDKFNENNCAINDVYNFIDKCNECTLEENRQIFYGIRKYYADKNENLPKVAVTIVSSLRTMIFDEKFSN